MATERNSCIEAAAIVLRSRTLVSVPRRKRYNRGTGKRLSAGDARADQMELGSLVLGPNEGAALEAPQRQLVDGIGLRSQPAMLLRENDELLRSREADPSGGSQGGFLCCRFLCRGRHVNGIGAKHRHPFRLPDEVFEQVGRGVQRCPPRRFVGKRSWPETPAAGLRLLRA